MISLLFSMTVFSQSPIYVNINATGANTGDDWENAFTTIQAGIDAANANAVEVWVARGIYYENIQLYGNVALYGGFSGSENERSQRNLSRNQSIIDGSNTWRAVEITGHNIIDGFIVQHGFFAYDDNDDGRGGGIFLEQAHGTIIRKCRVQENLSDRGAIYVSSTEDVLVEYCVVANNHGVVCAGGIELNYSTGIVRQCTIVDNISFGIEIPHREDQLLAVLYNNIVVGNVFNNHPRFAEPLPDNDLYQMAKMSNDHNFIGKIWDYSPIFGDPFNHDNLYGDYDSLTPEFMDHDNGDFHLRYNSPCIGTGRAGTTMGAFPEIVCAISGTVIYWNNDTPMENVLLTVLGNGITDSVHTDNSGFYDLIDLPIINENTMYTITPMQLDTADLNVHITIDDAISVAQYVMNNSSFNEYQTVAADCNRDGVVDMYDAALIARSVHQSTSLYDVGNCVFYPSEKTYNTLMENATDVNFRVVIVGDVDGE